MKYVRTHETRDKFLADKDSTSRGFRLAPTLYKYSDESEDEDNRDHIYLELDDPRKHEGSTYMEIALNSDVEFSFYIGNKSGDKQTTMTCTIDWGDDTTETKTIIKDTHGFKLAHNYTAGSYKIELYDVERDYSMVGDSVNNKSLISPKESVKRVVLGENVTSIGDWTFFECTSLTSVYIPKSVTYIGSRTLAWCSSLKSINIPESVTRIGDRVLDGGRSLKSIYLPEGVTRIVHGMFYGCRYLKSINIPESVTIIGSQAFDNCTSLTSVYIPESVTSIGYTAFGTCTSLTSIYIPKGVTTINRHTFYNCSSLKSIYLPEGITTINQYAFYGCKSLKSIDIPEKVTSIGDEAFYGCSSLSSISSFNLTTPTLGGNIFLNLPTNGTLHIKPGATGYDAWLSKLPEGWRIVEDL